MRTWLGIGGAATVSAAMFLAIMLGSFGALLLAYLAMLPLFLAGLGIGWMASGIAGLLGAAGVAFAVGPRWAAIFLVVFVLPAVVLTQRALLARPKDDDPASTEIEWYPTGLLTLWLCAIPVAAVSAMWLYYLGADGGLKAAVGLVVQQTMESFEASFEQITGASEASRAALEATIVANLPGWLALHWAFVVLLNGTLAQGLLVRFQRALRPSPVLAAMVLPRWVVLPFAVALALGLYGGGEIGYLASNLTPVLAMPLFLAGLAVVHALVWPLKARLPLLAAVYMLLVATPWGAFAATALGFADQWLNLRLRFRRTPPPGPGGNDATGPSGPD